MSVESNVGSATAIEDDIYRKVIFGLYRERSPYLLGKAMELLRPENRRLGLQWFIGEFRLKIMPIIDVHLPSFNEATWCEHAYLGAAICRGDVEVSWLERLKYHIPRVMGPALGATFEDSKNAHPHTNAALVSDMYPHLVSEKPLSGVYYVKSNDMPLETKREQPSLARSVMLHKHITAELGQIIDQATTKLKGYGSVRRFFSRKVPHELNALIEHAQLVYRMTDSTHVNVQEALYSQALTGKSEVEINEHNTIIMYETVRPFIAGIRREAAKLLS
jgi:hypothetical protein